MPYRRRLQLAAVLVALFGILTWAVMVGWPFGDIDAWGRSLTVDHHPGPKAGLVYYLVEFGQRGPTNKFALVYFVLLCLWRRNGDAMAVFVASFLMNNLFVGLVKLGVGRWGPRATANAHAVFGGGDIFPSGHVTNAVVLFGVLALTASPRLRKALVAFAVVVGLTVGLGTWWLDTHWLTDVLGGWLAGGIVLLLVPRFNGFTSLLGRLARKRAWAGASRVSSRQAGASEAGVGARRASVR